MEGYLAVPLDHDIAGAEVFFQPTVRLFRTGSNLVALRLVRRHRGHILASSISIDNRDMPKLPAGLFNPLGVVSGIHQVVEVGSDLLTSTIATNADQQHQPYEII